MTEYNITISNSKFDRGSSVVKNNFSDSNPKINEELLSEIVSISERLQKTEPLISKTLQDLLEEIKKKDRRKISDIISTLSTGFASSLLANVASGELLSFLGIPH